MSAALEVEVPLQRILLFRATLPGPSRRVTVEPVEIPDAPEPKELPAEPVVEPAREPAREPVPA
jgi:hypothetical protein